MEMTALNRELRELNNDRMIQKKVLDSEKERFASMLRGSMGEDIKETLSGHRVVKLSFKEKFKYKINYWLNKIFSVL